MLPLSDENERGTGPAFVSLAIIALNIAVFVLLQGAGASQQGEDFTYGYSAVPYEITNNVDLTEPTPITVDGTPYAVPQQPGPDPIWLTILTSMFMHGGWLHLLGNMLFLWIFGDNVEHAMGSFRFLVFYLLCGILATLAHILSAPSSQIPSLGASGAISGVLGAYIVLFPKQRVRVLVFRMITYMPAIAVIGMWIVLQFINGIGAMAQTEETGGVAYAAHVGGFIAGLALVWIFRRRSGPVRA